MSRFHFFVLVLIVAISGFSQGMLLPVISIIFEQQGQPSGLNGLHATGLYIGVLLASPFMEKPLRKFGYKNMIIVGGLLVVLSLFSFVFINSFVVWFFFRLLVGIGDHMLHFSTQTWLTNSVSKENRGRSISLYGLSFGLGFALGPFLAPLTEYSESLPFILSASLSLLGWMFIFKINNEYPEIDIQSKTSDSSIKRFAKALKYGWVAFLPPFGYGFLETTLHGNFPVYALQMDMSVNDVAVILPAFAIGSIVSQYPLGLLSDKFGRKMILSIVLFTGAASFFLASFTTSTILLFSCFFLAGMAVGSTFSLGISYMTDLLPKSLLPAGNLMCGIFFSIGSILGPVAGGYYMEFFDHANLFYFITVVLAATGIAIVFGKTESMKQNYPLGQQLS
ncbi:MFS transporter [Bacillus gobiensis]|uniref:MFS transporter n=1 Tax=Bacillus gobiensis TaxID=1441095 RepID=UPI003D1A988D